MATDNPCSVTDTSNHHSHPSLPHLSLPHPPPPHHPLQAIEVLGAERIGHGYHVVEDDSVYQLAKDRKVHFEVSKLIM